MTLEESTQRFEAHEISGDPYALFNLLEILEDVLTADGGAEWIRTALSSQWDPVKRAALLRSLSAAPFEGWVYGTLLEALEDEEPVVTAAALFTLVALQIALGEKASEYSSSPDAHVRAGALRLMLGRTVEGFYYLEQALKDESEIVRSTAVNLIDDHGLAGYEDQLARLKHDPSAAVRSAVETVEAHRRSSRDVD